MTKPTHAVVLMAKPAVSGAVKTRLIGDRCSPDQAAGVHAAMMRCVLDRLPRFVQPDANTAYVVAMDHRWTFDASTVPAPWRVIDQGEGDLGERMLRAWHHIGGGSVAFFGVDSPDAPATHLAAVARAMATCDAAFGPVDDGGYWALAARSLAPAVLQGVDWGTDAVLDQSCKAGAHAGLSVELLPSWHDVDEVFDLEALIARIKNADDSAIIRLRDELKELFAERKT